MCVPKNRRSLEGNPPSTVWEPGISGQGYSRTWDIHRNRRHLGRKPSSVCGVADQADHAFLASNPARVKGYSDVVVVKDLSHGQEVLQNYLLPGPGLECHNMVFASMFVLSPIGLC